MDNNVTNTVGVSKAASTSDMMEVIAKLQATLPPKESIPHELAAGDLALMRLKAFASADAREINPLDGAFSKFAGIKVVLDSSLPLDVIELRNSDGKLLKRLVT